jgi:putative ATP-dependent endonuclease of OLD family
VILGEWSIEEFDEQPATDTGGLEEWLPSLETHGVYFASPLDLDWSMLSAFFEQYSKVEPGYGPRIPAAGPALQKRIKEAIAQTLKEHGGDGGTYAGSPQQHLIWYTYLFLGKGKPASHILALNRLTDLQLLDKCPPVLKRLVDSAKARLNEQVEAEPA